MVNVFTVGVDVGGNDCTELFRKYNFGIGNRDWQSGYFGQDMRSGDLVVLANGASARCLGKVVFPLMNIAPKELANFPADVRKILDTEGKWILFTVERWVKIDMLGQVIVGIDNTRLDTPYHIHDEPNSGNRIKLFEALAKSIL